jgi:exopolyphosphatase/pppGpp-phosphohydrolase
VSDPSTAPRPRVGAAVDLGSNSVHLLVAELDEHDLRPLVDESVFLGLGAAVDDGGSLGPDARRLLVATLDGYARTARSLGADAITFLGTEPIRRAADTAEIVREIGEGTGVVPYVVSHEEEALLTLVGVMGGHSVECDTLVLDVGGGSTEFVLVGPDRPAVASGLRLGSNRLTGRLVRHDPPTSKEVRSLLVEARMILDAAPVARPAEIVAVGGTASNLLKLHPAALLDRTLTRPRIAASLDLLREVPAASITRRLRINPMRSRLLPAGAAIMDAILARYGTGRIRVSEAGVREGAILAVAEAGPAWRERLEVLAHGWRA